MDCKTHGYPDAAVLTEKGWKMLSTVQEGEKLMTLAPDGKTLTYASVEKCVTASECASTLAFRNRNLSLYIVPGQLVYTHQAKTGEAKLVSVQDLKGEDYMPSTGYKWEGQDNPVFILPATNQDHAHQAERKIDMKDWLEFFGFWLADGCTTTMNRIKITQSKNNSEYVIDLLNRTGFQYRIESNTENANNYVIRDTQLYTYLSQFGRSEDKYIPQEFLMLSTEYLERLYYGYIMGDSHKEKASVGLSTVSPKMVDNLQELLLKCKGVLVRFHEYERMGRKNLFKGQFIEDGLKTGMHFCKPQETQYHGHRYHIEMQTQEPILMRHDERVMWVANQQYEANAAGF